jgi:hypothetical protein
MGFSGELFLLQTGNNEGFVQRSLYAVSKWNHGISFRQYIINWVPISVLLNSPIYSLRKSGHFRRISAFFEWIYKSKWVDFKTIH